MLNRWFWFPISLLLAGACASVPSRTLVIPTVAYPFDRGTLVRSDVAACADTVAERAWNGLASFERAAFLRVREGGTFDCQLWPVSFEFRRAEWFGQAPDGTVAIIHSHPRNLPDPSDHDRQEALLLDVPIIVVTPEAVTMVLPGAGTVVRAARMNAGGFRVAYTAHDEAARDRHSHARQTGPLPDKRSRAHP